MKYLVHLSIAATLLLSACSGDTPSAAAPEPAEEISADNQQKADEALERATLLMNLDHPEMGGQDYEGAIEALTESIKYDPTNELVYLYRATCNGRLTRPKSAVKDLDKAIELDPTFAIAYRSRAGLKYQLQDYEGAEADYTTLVEMRPDDGQAFYNRAAIRGQMNHAHTCKDLERAIELGRIDTTDFLYKRHCGE